MLDYISVQQAADQWEISKRIAGAVHFGHVWAIPKKVTKLVTAD